MAVTGHVPGAFVVATWTAAGIDLETDTLKMVLCGSAEAGLDIDTTTYYDDLTAELPTANGYTQGGATLTGVTVDYDDSNHRAYLDSDAVEWTATAGNSIAARYAVIVDAESGNPETSPVVAWYDFGEEVEATGAKLTVTPHANGLLLGTVS